MEITLQKIELVKDRTGVSYKEAKEALEQTEGNVIDAIIYIEEKAIENEESKISADKKEILEKIKAVVKKGNVTKIQFKKGDQVILNVPVTAGAIGTVIFPLPVITAAVAAIAAKCSIEIIKDDGEVVDINELSGGRIENIRDKTEDIIVNIGEKAGDAFDDIKIKAGDAYENVKYKAAERKERKAQEKEDDFEFEVKEDCDCCCDCEIECEVEYAVEDDKDPEEKQE
ncbi:MAG: DUF4342 domain-containing protein [Firmicutes bacterium]|nr:DUF4342 domain-containing protein [Clostridiales bacterium]MBQ4339866.1 DUF4342 domain-containing protein [Bacillota bacterium]